MSEYTPTTEQVRMSFVTDDHDRYTDPGPEFDRWLAAHDREVAARTRRELRGLMAAAYTAGYRDRREERSYDPGGNWGTSEYSGLGRVVWEASRQDEGTISALGADVVAKAVLGSDWLAAHDREVAARSLRELHAEMSTDWHVYETRDIGRAFLADSVLERLEDAADAIERGEVDV